MAGHCGGLVIDEEDEANATATVAELRKALMA